MDIRAYLRLGYQLNTQLDEPTLRITCPVSKYPEKVTSFNFDKTATVAGRLNGIKAQYLLFDHGVINMRKFSGYEVVVL